MATVPNVPVDVPDLSESPTGRWHRTVSDIVIRDEIIGHTIIDYRPDGTVEAYEVQHCHPCMCWQ